MNVEFEHLKRLAARLRAEHSNRAGDLRARDSTNSKAKGDLGGGESVTWREKV